MTAASYIPGGWLGLVRSGTAVILGPDTPAPLVNTSHQRAVPRPRSAAVSTGDQGPGGSLGVFAIMGGVLLVGFAGLVFALWSRNRLAGHW